MGGRLRTMWQSLGRIVCWRWTTQGLAEFFDFVCWVVQVIDLREGTYAMCKNCDSPQPE